MVGSVVTSFRKVELEVEIMYVYCVAVVDDSGGGESTNRFSQRVSEGGGPLLFSSSSH